MDKFLSIISIFLAHAIVAYGIAETTEEREEVISEAKQILDVEDVIASILLVDDLRVQKN